MEISSIVANFDELQRCQDVLTDGTAEIEFRRFLHIMGESRMQWQETIAEAQRLQKELDRLQRKYDDCIQERLDFETKLFHARRLLEAESKAKRQLEDKLSTVCDFLHTDRGLNNNVRDTLASLNMSHKRGSRSNRYEDRYCNEINSTGSFLSDLSMTQFDDDFLETTKPFKKHCPSTTTTNISFVESKQRRRSARRSMDLYSKKNTSIFDLDEPDQLIATATITIPQDNGPIEAVSKIEAVPNAALYEKFRKIDTENQASENYPEIVTTTPTKQSIGSSTLSIASKLSIDSKKTFDLAKDSPVPSAPPLEEITNRNEKLLPNIPARQHEFNSRTIIRSESCVYCLKKLRFGTSALKCRMCSIYLHTDCKAHYTIACVPKSHDKHGKHGHISDYVPAENPMIPPLIVHCISEVESRGLSEKGIYRVSGSEKEIKLLKERILRGKSTLNLSTVDIHVICGCIKDFLRGLREPLIPSNLWKNFSNAVQSIEEKKIERQLYNAIDLLPQANRDTLAYLILHLQRVANSKTVQMPIENLAKIFGPTVLGYSCSDIDHHAILSETMVQKDVMENLLKIPANFWARFINAVSTRADSQKAGKYSFFGTPNARLLNSTIRKERKIFTTPPYSSRR
ncbi:rac GTPase-activating protein 1-like [Contarinia nasturtii]|uniref:rac GTPase-activating protein 1-like n=1 Tax=Contarinia nasturtii TaxID=265458 RepID=UPI0012D4BA17|nr:rac GTPase-activating protein 1-like [Contarinia nasturtii]